MASTAGPDADANTNEPILEEIIYAIKKLKDGHTASTDWITAELLKGTITPIAERHLTLFRKIL